MRSMFTTRLAIEKYCCSSIWTTYFEKHRISPFDHMLMDRYMQPYASRIILDPSLDGAK